MHILIAVAAFVVAFSAAAPAEDFHKDMVPLTPCKEWCANHCETECAKKGHPGAGWTHECHSDSACYCSCPAQKADCTPEWCQNFCTLHSSGRKFESSCKSAATCQCKFHMTNGAVQQMSNSP